jgi:hypothetical protein
VSDWAVLATGTSMSPALAARTAHLPCVAVSNAWRIAPHARALASSDAAWWRAHPDALDFPGRKFSIGRVDGIEHIQLATSSNSGLLGLHVAKLLGATRIFLFGVDLHGSHYFGDHPAPLQNTQPHRFEVMRAQFKRWVGPPVFNCSPISALDAFPFMDPEDVLC